MASSERFGYEWGKYKDLIPQYEEQFLKWVYPLTQESFQGKDVLDAGCGMGRNAYWAASYGASHVTAFDLDDRSLAAARTLLKRWDTVEVVKGDIKHFDTERRYDIIFSIGVIHHLRHPDVALRNLTRLLKPGGTILVWVYGYENNEVYVRLLTPLRKYVTSRLPLPIVHLVSYLFSVPLYLYLRVGNPRREYLRQLRHFSFAHIHSIIFDQLIPAIANYWTREEAENLFASSTGCATIKTYPVNDMSWTVVGIKQ